METRGEAVVGIEFRALIEVALTALVLLIGLAVVASARATVGELGQVGSGFGPGPEQFEWPQDLAVDSANNYAFVLDAPGAAENGVGPASFRIREFSANLGAPIASASVPTPLVEGRVQNVEGMAIDPKVGKLYVLKGAEGENGEYFATEIEAYSTANLEAKGSYYKFPHKVGGEPHELKDPHGLAVDPTTGDLIVLGAEVGDTVLQRLHEGILVGEPFVDNLTPKVIAQQGSWANGIGVGHDGSIYLVVSTLPTASGSYGGIVRLSPEFQAAKVVFEQRPSPSRPVLTGGAITGEAVDYGPQVAVAPEENLVYAAETDKEPEELTPGSYEIRGISTEEGPNLGSQRVVFGGGSTGHCEIGSSKNAVAAGSDGVVYALDEGAFRQGGPTPYGFDLVKFGSGGSGCPIPTVSFTSNGRANSEKLTIAKGEKVEFDASTNGLGGEAPSELEWALEGDEKYTKMPGSALATSRWYPRPGKYKIGLKVLLENGGNFGEPEPAFGELEVVAPAPTASFEASTISAKPGEPVTFDGSGSVDPTGLCEEAKEVCKPTNALKSYTWAFGDGRTETTTTNSYSRTFENPSSEARMESVSLTVTNNENVQSSATTQTVTILGTASTGGGGGGPVGGSSNPPTVLPPGPGPTVTGSEPKALTKAQKLTRALATCKKMKPKHKRLNCEKEAKRRFAPKGSSRKRRTKKK